MRRTTRLKRVARLVSGGTPHVAEDRYWTKSDEGTPWVAIGDMTRDRLIKTSARHLTEEGLRAKSLYVGEPGTLLFAMYASVGEIAVLACRAAWNQAILGVLPDPNLAEARYVRYWLEHLKPTLAELFRSNTQNNLSGEQVGTLPFPVLDVHEQRAIADFLNRETARIDALIAKKQNLGFLLDERRKETISLGVRGLLEPGRTAHDVGIPWAPTIRAPWPGVMIKHFAALGTGHTPSRSRPELWEGADIPWITTGEIKQVRDDRQEVLVDTRECVSPLGIANSAAELHAAGTVVLCRTASAGYSAIMGKDMATSQDFVTWTSSDRLLPRYLLMCLRAMRSDLLGRLAYGSTHRTIYWPDVESLKIPLPTVSEQTEVLRQIDKKLRPIDLAHQKLAQQVEVLQEHRQVLITAAVTGQMETPSAA